jgi:hypothetical protein
MVNVTTMSTYNNIIIIIARSGTFDLQQFSVQYSYHNNNIIVVAFPSIDSVPISDSNSVFMHSIEWCKQVIHDNYIMVTCVHIIIAL